MLFGSLQAGQKKADLMRLCDMTPFPGRRAQLLRVEFYGIAGCDLIPRKNIYFKTQRRTTFAASPLGVSAPFLEPPSSRRLGRRRRGEGAAHAGASFAASGACPPGLASLVFLS